jgi:hypothetical protein
MGGLAVILTWCDACDPVLLLQYIHITADQLGETISSYNPSAYSLIVEPSLFQNIPITRDHETGMAHSHFSNLLRHRSSP